MKEQPEEEAFQRAREEASKLARSVSESMITMVLLASPRLAARMAQWPSREEMLEQMETYLRYVDRERIGASGMILDVVNSEPHALKLRELFRAWTPSAPVPAHIEQAARDFLAAFEFTGPPPEGWDNFEGLPDANEEPSS